MKKYEAMVILANRVEDSKLDEKIEIIRGEITRAGGTLDNVTRLGRRGFARQLRKRDAGLYLLVTFSADPAKLAGLNEHLSRSHQEDDIFRVQIEGSQDQADLAEDGHGLRRGMMRGGSRRSNAENWGRAWQR